MKNNQDIRKPVLGYMCSYFPKKFFTGLGFQVIPIHEIQTDSNYECMELSVNICGYVRYYQKRIKNVNVDGIILTNCCNSMQRLYDYIKVERKDLFCYLLEIPRKNTMQEHRFYHTSLLELLEKISIHFSVDCSHEAFVQRPVSVKDEKIADDTILVMGSAVSIPIIDKVREYMGSYQVVTNLCWDRDCGDKMLENYLYNETISNIVMEPCARSEDFLDWFEGYISENQSFIKGIIYFTSQHCDSYLFNYPLLNQILTQYGIPIIKLEEEYKQTGLGQISTRLEAFLERIAYQRELLNKNIGSEKSNLIDAGNDFKQRMRLVKGVVSQLPLRAINKLVENQVDIFTIKMWSNPEKIVWTNMVMPVEILYALDLIPVNIELLSGWLATLGLTRKYIAISEGAGLSPLICSYFKAAVGVIDDNKLPKPGAAIMTSAICDGSMGLLSFFRKRYDTKTLLINVPYHKGAEGLSYVIKQFEDMIKWLERQYGVTLNSDRLTHALALSNQARRYWIKAFELRKGSPILPGHLSLRNLFGATFLFGSQLGLDVAESYYNQLKEGITENEHQESKRILWIHFAPLYNNKIMEYLEKELNCWIVMDITGYMYWQSYDVTKPIESIAKRTLSHFYLGEAGDRMKLYQRLIREYKIDGIIHFMHNGCRTIPGSSWLVREVANDSGIPYLELTGDCIDPRGFSEQQTKLRMEAFKEALTGRD